MHLDRWTIVNIDEKTPWQQFIGKAVVFLMKHLLRCLRDASRPTLVAFAKNSRGDDIHAACTNTERKETTNLSSNLEQGSNLDSGRAKPSPAPAGIISSARLNPTRLGLGFGATGVVFYLGCMLTMAIVPREKAVVFFNSPLHGFNIEPILRTSVPAGEIVLGLIMTFILGGLAGVLIAGFYNLGLRKSGQEPYGRWPILMMLLPGNGYSQRSWEIVRLSKVKEEPTPLNADA